MLFVYALPMSTLVHFSPELRAWIGHNLARGCARSTLVDSMVAQGFESRIADGMVTAFATASARGAPLPDQSVVLDLDTVVSYVPDPPRLTAGNRSGRQIVMSRY